EYDRYGCGCSFRGQRSRRGQRNDRGRGIGRQLGSHCRQSVEATIAGAIFDRDVAPFDVADVLEALPNSSDLSIIELGAEEHADQRDPGLLRPRRERPRGRRAADKRDERAPLHSITSSAIASNLSGISRPSALAVLRSMTNSYLLGA